MPERHGRRIGGAGTATLTIEGVERLHGTHYDVLPDRIETGTFLVAGAITGRRIVAKRTRPKTLDAVLAKAGGRRRPSQRQRRRDRAGHARQPSARGQHHHGAPSGLSTDMQAQFAALNCVAEGVGVITETVFENRFMHAHELQRLGADIRLEGNTAIIRACPR